MMKWAAIVLLASAPASADPLVRAITTWPGSRLPDPVAMILQTAEEL